MTNLNRITIDPAKMNGQACIRGMRLTVRRVLEALAMYPDRPSSIYKKLVSIPSMSAIWEWLQPLMKRSSMKPERKLRWSWL